MCIFITTNKDIIIIVIIIIITIIDIIIITTTITLQKGLVRATSSNKIMLVEVWSQCVLTNNLVFEMVPR